MTEDENGLFAYHERTVDDLAWPRPYEERLRTAREVRSLETWLLRRSLYYRLGDLLERWAYSLDSRS
jgi:hypothetical protein